MTWKRRYSDEQLIEAIAASNSWRGLLRELGLVATSSAAMRSVRSHADRRGADYSHFKGQRRWTEEELRAAIDAARTWSEVAKLLRIPDAFAASTLKGHAARLGLDFTHLTVPPAAARHREREPDLAHLDRTGGSSPRVALYTASVGIQRSSGSVAEHWWIDVRAS